MLAVVPRPYFRSRSLFWERIDYLTQQMRKKRKEKRKNTQSIGTLHKKLVRVVGCVNDMPHYRLADVNTDYLGQPSFNFTSSMEHMTLVIYVLTDKQTDRHTTI